jgi:hypothetical protein
VPFRGSAIVPTILFFLSRALKRCLPVYTRAFLEWTTLAPCVSRLTSRLQPIPTEFRKALKAPQNGFEVVAMECLCHPF